MLGVVVEKPSKSTVPFRLKLGSLPGNRLFSMGFDGLATLLLANLVIVGTAGLSLAVCFYRVWRVARNVPARVAIAGRPVVLGVCLRRGRVPGIYARRLAKAQELAADGRILVLGGHTSQASFSEAEAGRDWLIARGVPAAAITIEDRSRNTLENLRAARDILGAAEGVPIVVTNRYHLARSGLLADSLGMRHVLCAAEERLRADPMTVVRLLLEAYFVNWFFVGRRWASLTGNSGMLERIT